MKVDLNVYSGLARLAHLVSQSDCSLVLLFMPVLASNLLILAHGRENIDNLFLVNSYLPGCCIAKIVSIYAVHRGLKTELQLYNVVKMLTNCYK